MFSGSHIRPILIVAAGSFAFVAGVVNMTALLSAAHITVSHATGNVSLLARAAYEKDGELASRVGAALLAFLIGALVSGFATGGRTFRFERRYGVLMAAEGLLLLFAAWSFRSGRPILAESVAALACGMQNGMVTTVSGAIVRTTHLTGVITDIGTELGRALRGGRIHTSRLVLYGSITASFWAGALAVGAVFQRAPLVMLFSVASALVLLGTAYFCWRLLARPNRQ